MREDEELLDIGRPKVKPPPNLRGRDLDMWHKEQNRLWQKSKKKEQQKESGKCVCFKLFYQYVYFFNIYFCVFMYIILLLVYYKD